MAGAADGFEGSFVIRLQTDGADALAPGEDGSEDFRFALEREDEIYAVIVGGLREFVYSFQVWGLGEDDVQAIEAVSGQHLNVACSELLGLILIEDADATECADGDIFRRGVLAGGADLFGCFEESVHQAAEVAAEDAGSADISVMTRRRAGSILRPAVAIVVKMSSRRTRLVDNGVPAPAVEIPVHHGTGCQSASQQ